MLLQPGCHVWIHLLRCIPAADKVEVPVVPVRCAVRRAHAHKTLALATKHLHSLTASCWRAEQVPTATQAQHWHLQSRQTCMGDTADSAQDLVTELHERRNCGRLGKSGMRAARHALLGSFAALLPYSAQNALLRCTLQLLLVSSAPHAHPHLPAPTIVR